MAKKMTRKQYNARKEFLAKALASAQAYMAEMRKEEGNLASVGLGYYDLHPETNEDPFNAINDKIRTIQGLQHELENDWHRRNWTSADYTSHRLICDNID